ncbi:MAG: hypothetical protein RSE07_03645, partial [Oscillospiraceae bacterium]
ESEKQLIAQNLNGKTAAMYLNLTCAVVFYNADTGVFRVQQLTDMQQPMRLTVDIGEYAGKGENYCVLREHAGVVDELAATLNGTLLTFESSKFSTYSVAYTAFAQPTPTPMPSVSPSAAPVPTSTPQGKPSAKPVSSSIPSANISSSTPSVVPVPSVAASVVPKQESEIYPDDNIKDDSDTAASANHTADETLQAASAWLMKWWLLILIAIALATAIVVGVLIVKKHKKGKHAKK